MTAVTLIDRVRWIGRNTLDLLSFRRSDRLLQMGDFGFALHRRESGEFEILVFGATKVEPMRLSVPAADDFCEGLDRMLRLVDVPGRLS